MPTGNGTAVAHGDEETIFDARHEASKRVILTQPLIRKGLLWIDISSAGFGWPANIDKDVYDV